MQVAILATTSACRGAAPEPTFSSPAAASNTLLAELAREDVASRTGQTIARTDFERQRLVLAEIGSGHVRTPEDKVNAALVLQHSGLRVRDGKLEAISPDNYLLAHHLASSAFEEGYQRARHLVAQTIDRYLSMTQGYQKYGTNRFINQQTGEEELTPIDRNTTDAERAKYGVAPLAELLKQFPEQKKPARSP